MMSKLDTCMIFGLEIPRTKLCFLSYLRKANISTQERYKVRVNGKINQGQ